MIEGTEQVIALVQIVLDGVEAKLRLDLPLDTLELTIALEHFILGQLVVRGTVTDEELKGLFRFVADALHPHGKIEAEGIVVGPEQRN